MKKTITHRIKRCEVRECEAKVGTEANFCPEHRALEEEPVEILAPPTKEEGTTNPINKGE